MECRNFLLPALSTALGRIGGRKKEGGGEEGKRNVWRRRRETMNRMEEGGGTGCEREKAGKTSNKLERYIPIWTKPLKLMDEIKISF